MPSAWVEHVRKWAKDHDLSYMCAATDIDCRNAYHKGILPEKKKAAKKMNKSLGELKDKYPSYAEMKSQRTEQQQMGGEDRNILKVPRPPSTMIGVSNVELPEPPQEPKRVVVGKTIRVKRSEPAPVEEFEQSPVLVKNTIKYFSMIKNLRKYWGYLFSEYEKQNVLLNKRSDSNVRVNKLFIQGILENIDESETPVKAQLNEVFSKKQITEIDNKSNPESMYIDDDELLEYGFRYNKDTRQYDVDTRKMRKFARNEMAELTFEYFDIMRKFGINQHDASMMTYTMRVEKPK